MTMMAMVVLSNAGREEVKLLMVARRIGVANENDEDDHEREREKMMMKPRVKDGDDAVLH